jgi:hypothetical protein
MRIRMKLGKASECFGHSMAITYRLPLHETGNSIRAPLFGDKNYLLPRTTIQQIRLKLGEVQVGMKLRSYSCYFNLLKFGTAGKASCPFQNQCPV